MYAWLVTKVSSRILAGLIAATIYTLLILLIILFSALPESSFRYLEI